MPMPMPIPMGFTGVEGGGTPVVLRVCGGSAGGAGDTMACSMRWIVAAP
jgi:hypothetical protein